LQPLLGQPEIISQRGQQKEKMIFSWQTSLDPGGTPGRENSPGFVEIEKEEKKNQKFLSLFQKKFLQTKNLKFRSQFQI
jgi:hypothetical protein